MLPFCKGKVLLHIRVRWLHTYYYISASPNEVRDQTSISTLTEGEVQFPTQNMCEPSFNINNYNSTKQDWCQKLKNV